MVLASSPLGLLTSRGRNLFKNKIDAGIEEWKQLPNMTAYDFGYQSGFASEKIIEAVALSKGVGLATNAVKSAATASRASSLGNAARGSKQIFEIGDGVRRAKAAQ